MIAVVMGVSGAGKSKVSTLVAARLGWRYVDADDLHSSFNIAKMHAGIPLSDQDREPWLEKVHEVVSELYSGGASGVIACSALKDAYRRKIAGIDERHEVRFILLDVAPGILQTRLARRPHHYMNPDLLPSQLDILEVSGVDMVCPNNGSLSDTVSQIVTYLKEQCANQREASQSSGATPTEGNAHA